MIFSIGRWNCTGRISASAFAPSPLPAPLYRAAVSLSHFWKIPNASRSHWQKSCCPALGNKIAQAQRFLKSRETLLHFLPTNGCFLELLAPVGRQGHGADTPGLTPGPCAGAGIRRRRRLQRRGNAAGGPSGLCAQRRRQRRPGLRRQAHSLLRKRRSRPSHRNFVANVPCMTQNML